MTQAVLSNTISGAKCPKSRKVVKDKKMASKMNVLTAKAISLTVCCCQQSKWKIWWRHIYVIWRNYLNLAVFKGVRGIPRQDLAFRAHEMRILRHSMECLLHKNLVVKNKVIT